MPTVRYQLRGDTAANWAAVNPVLKAKEPGLETDTLLVKYGDGATDWNSLPYSAVNLPTILEAIAGATPIADGTHTIGANTITTVSGLITAIT
ncbi:PE-PGRS family protein [Sphingobium yanoikuyae]|uniref:PE-PGRS family protein n=1 Tax=Sphingobium yanoikuyae TaxID=13690 RepID=A0A6M4G0L0_SPHYA|nr:PE-PGRS family protein [Sphingobium yanoikuyae]QJR00872.1 PE-PGRS family protein [Sphingobium yanoikuyae]